jgi:hypothetical protein
VPTTGVPDREIRVLIQSPGDPAFPEPGRRFLCAADGQAAVELRGPLRLRVVGERSALQVGAFGQPENAQAAAGRLREAGIEADERAGDGLVRVVAVGRAGEAEEALGARVGAAGVAEASRAAPATGSGGRRGESAVTVVGRVLRL